MKIKRKEQIDGYTIITLIDDIVFDGEATDAKIASMITPETTKDEYNILFNQNLEPAKIGQEAEFIEDDIAEQYQLKLSEAGEHRLLLNNGTYIIDYRNTEYWIKNNNCWEKEKIIILGKEIPTGGIPIDDLNKEEYQEQREAISDQVEKDRLEALDPVKKADELQVALDALADEAARLEKRAQIQGKEFDTIAWYQEGELRLREKYGL